MGAITAKSFDQPDDVLTLPRLSMRIVVLGNTHIARTVHQPGWCWSKDVKPVVGTGSCQHHHQGVVLSGCLCLISDDGGERNIGPGEAFDVAPGHDSRVVGDVACETIEFQGVRGWGKPMEAGERILATLLITDIVGSTATAARLGDVAWRELFARHCWRVRLELDRFRGYEIATTGDGFLAMFDGAARAVRCAASICEIARSDGIDVRSGVHSGEVEREGEDLRGVAVHITARIAALADAGAVLVSAATASILEGSGLAFADAGEHELKGLAQRRQLFRLIGTGGALTGARSD